MWQSRPASHPDRSAAGVSPMFISAPLPRSRAAAASVGSSDGRSAPPRPLCASTCGGDGALTRTCWAGTRSRPRAGLRRGATVARHRSCEHTQAAHRARFRGLFTTKTLQLPMPTSRCVIPACRLRPCEIVAIAAGCIVTVAGAAGAAVFEKLYTYEYYRTLASARDGCSQLNSGRDCTIACKDVKQGSGLSGDEQFWAFEECPDWTSVLCGTLADLLAAGWSISLLEFNGCHSSWLVPGSRMYVCVSRDSIYAGSCALSNTDPGGNYDVPVRAGYGAAMGLGLVTVVIATISACRGGRCIGGSRVHGTATINDGSGRVALLGADLIVEDGDEISARE